jgi:phage shock protein C
MNSNASTTHPRRLHRSTSDRVVAGVAGGLGEYFSVDPVLFRAGFAVATILSGGAAALVYLAIVLVRPTGADDAAPAGPHPAAA